MPNVVIVALSLMREGLSGGDIRLRAMMLRWQAWGKLTVITNPSGGRNMATWGIAAEYVLSCGFPEKWRIAHDAVAQLSNCWFSVCLSLRRRFRGAKCDVIYVQSDFLHEMWAAARMKKRFPRARLIATCHHSYGEILETKRSIPYRLMYATQKASYRLMARYADMVMVHATLTGDRIGADLRRSGVDPERIVTMRNGVDLDRIPANPPKEREFDACVIGLRLNKGLDDIVEIWRHVCDKRPTARLLIIGAVAERDQRRLLREIDAAKLTANVTLGGHFDHPEIYHQIQRARICVAPTHQEPYGIAVCEAMACGLPVVGYDLPNYQRLHPGIFRTAPCFDRGALAVEVDEILSHPEKLEERSRAGLDHIRSFDNDRIAKDDWDRLFGL